MKYFAVIDTNVLVSAQLRPDSIPGRVLEEAFAGKIIPLVHPDILWEYREVLSRKKFKFDSGAIEVLLKCLTERGVSLEAADVNDLVSDPKDVIFYQVVMEGRRKYRDAYLVTGNIADFPTKFFIVTPREMLEIIENDKDPYYNE